MLVTPLTGTFGSFLSAYSVCSGWCERLFDGPRRTLRRREAFPPADNKTHRTARRKDESTFEAPPCTLVERDVERRPCLVYACELNGVRMCV
jgi:hypothetical protein